MNKLSDYPQLVQALLKQNKKKRKSWKGIVPTRKSTRLNKESDPWIIKNELLNDESYHGDFEDNDSLDGETLENNIQNFENDLQVILYRSQRFNDWNLTKEKLRLVQ